MAFQKGEFYRMRAEQLRHLLFGGLLSKTLKDIRLVSFVQQRFCSAFECQVLPMLACRVQQGPDAMAPDSIFHKCFTDDFR